MPRPLLTISQIEAFCALARHKSFKQAAGQLGLSQPSLIHKISQIEENYGARLFIRQRNNNRLTALGLAVLPKLQASLASLREAEFILLAHSQVETGEIHIAAVSPYRVSLLIKRFHALYPNIKVRVTFASSERVEALVASGDVDAGFFVVRSANPGLQSFFFYQYQLVALVPVGHPLAGKAQLMLSDFANQDFISREPGSLTRERFDEALRNADVGVNAIYELGSRESIREAVAQGLGISVVADDEHVPHERIQVKQIVGVDLAQNSSLVIANDQLTTPLSKALLQVVNSA
ncbi:MAG: LysR substrate-binding domain-containing protein [Marinobacterium sp.]|nr:LysR substrate-binding domain-containing protein [Marinobacterium sp.]